ncbi:Hypothetical_protein [Hexamita inflata]|uniref:Hypothetical_protein n=1 Tax=Hexamita inflata TaxID=28002 RepID=A0AA86PIU7_9EUKA|nr:Hypothetical protein HINF_LOCUS24052 [Hexamita inflata]
MQISVQNQALHEYVLERLKQASNKEKSTPFPFPIIVLNPSPILSAAEEKELRQQQTKQQLEIVYEIQLLQQKQLLMWKEDMQIKQLLNSAKTLHTVYGQQCLDKLKSQRVEEINQKIQLLRQYVNYYASTLQTQIATDLGLSVFICEYKISELEDQSRVTQQNKNLYSSNSQTIKKTSKK